MALALFVRNASKVNGACLLRTASVAPLKTYTTAITSKTAAKQLLFPKNVAPLSREITLSAPKMSAAGANHATLWTVERAISLGLLGIIPAAFVFPSQIMDSLLATSIVLHQHWGIEAMVMDYVRPAVVGGAVSKIAHVSLYLLSIATLGGLFYFIYNDIGIAKSVKKLWSIKGQ